MLTATPGRQGSRRHIDLSEGFVNHMLGLIDVDLIAKALTDGGRRYGEWHGWSYP
jgi:hypothetical protein